MNSPGAFASLVKRAEEKYVSLDFTKKKQQTKLFWKIT